MIKKILILAVGLIVTGCATYGSSSQSIKSGLGSIKQLDIYINPGLPKKIKYSWSSKYGNTSEKAKKNIVKGILKYRKLTMDNFTKLFNQKTTDKFDLTAKQIKDQGGQLSGRYVMRVSFGKAGGFCNNSTDRCVATIKYNIDIFNGGEKIWNFTTNAKRSSSFDVLDEENVERVVTALVSSMRNDNLLKK